MTYLRNAAAMLLLVHGQALAQVSFPLGGTADDFDPTVLFDASGNVYMAVSTTGQLDMDPGPQEAAVSSTNGRSVVVASYDPAGCYRWSRLLEIHPVDIHDAEDDADLPAYGDGWDDGDISDGFSGWFTISEFLSASGGRREIVTSEPLDGGASWRLIPSNGFHGVGRTLANPMFAGRINLLFRHDHDPDGSFRGFNLSGSLSPSSFGALELISFGLTASNTIDITTGPGVHHYVSPTADQDMRGDKLEFDITVRTSGVWTISIVNHDEPDAPVITQDLAIALPTVPVRTVRFGCFNATTNDTVTFDRIRLNRGSTEAGFGAVTLSPDRFHQNVWVHGAFAGALSLSGGSTSMVKYSVGGTNGFAILLDMDGQVADYHQVMTTNGYGHSSIDSVAGTFLDGTMFAGSFAGTLHPGPTQAFTSVDGDDVFLVDRNATGGIRRVYYISAVGPVSVRGMVSVGGTSLYLLGNYACGSNHLLSAGIAGQSDQLGGFRGGAGSDVYLIWLNAVNGSFLSRRGIRGNGDQAAGRHGIARDPAGHIYFAGSYELDLFASNSIASRGASDLFIGRTDGNLDAWEFALVGGEGDEVYGGLGVDTNGFVVLGGSSQSEVECSHFCSGTETDTVCWAYSVSGVATNGGYDGFVARYSPDGFVQWVQSIHGMAMNTGIIRCTSIALAETLLWAGDHDGDVSCIIGPSEIGYAGQGGRDAMVLEMLADGDAAGARIRSVRQDATALIAAIVGRTGTDVLVERKNSTGIWDYVTNTVLTGLVTDVTIQPSPGTGLYRGMSRW